MSDPQLPPPGYFPTTQWTQIINVIQQGDNDAAWKALVEFCERYRPAIYHFFRRRGCPHGRAEDYTQEFFSSRVLQRWDQHESFLHTAKKTGTTRFRKFLCQILWRFLQDEWKKEKTQKAGGGAEHVLFNDQDFPGEWDSEEAFGEFDREFARIFALEIIKKAASCSTHAEYLLGYFMGELKSQQAAAKKAGISEAAFKMAYHHFRKRLELELWNEVGRQVGPDEKEIRAEIKYLMTLFQKHSA